MQQLVLHRATVNWLARLAGYCVLLAGLILPRASFATEDAAAIKYFEEKIRPLLIAHCYECHSAEAKELRGSLLLDTKAGWQKGGENGPAIVPGKPKASLFVRAINYADEELQMPPKGKLPQAEIDVLTKWIEQGAADPREGKA